MKCFNGVWSHSYRIVNNFHYLGDIRFAHLVTAHLSWPQSRRTQEIVPWIYLQLRLRVVTVSPLVLIVFGSTALAVLVAVILWLCKRKPPLDASRTEKIPPAATVGLPNDVAPSPHEEEPDYPHEQADSGDETEDTEEEAPPAAADQAQAAPPVPAAGPAPSLKPKKIGKKKQAKLEQKEERARQRQVRVIPFGQGIIYFALRIVSLVPSSSMQEFQRMLEERRKQDEARREEERLAEEERIAQEKRQVFIPSPSLADGLFILIVRRKEGGVGGEGGRKVSPQRRRYFFTVSKGGNFCDSTSKIRMCACLSQRSGGQVTTGETARHQTRGRIGHVSLGEAATQ